MSNLFICSYNNFSKLAHIPNGIEAKLPFSVNEKKYIFKKNINPAFVLKNPQLPYFYVCSESIYSGYISTFVIKNNKLEHIKTVSSCGKSSCYLAFDNKMEYLININYWDSIISIHPLKNNIIQEATQVIKPKINNNINKINDHLKDRQSTSHHHSCVFFKKKLYVPDLGTDKIDIYDYNNGNLKFTDFIQLQKGSGPRYSVINNGHIYIINELSSSITIINLEDESKSILQNIKTIPKDFLEKNTCGTIQINRNKNLIFASNRGHDSIAVYKILENNKLELIEIKKTIGKTPRHFSLSKCGEKLYVANQDSNNVVTFKINLNCKLYFENIIKCNSPNFVLEIN